MTDLRIDINLATCIKCGHCAGVCPMKILVQNESTKDIAVQYLENCIICGQCAAICPTNALKHSEFPPETLHRIDAKELPSPEALELLIRSRRSNRAFSEKPIPVDSLMRIMQAAHRAPTGSNSQTVEFTLVRSADKLKEIEEYTVSVFETALKALKAMTVKSEEKADPELMSMIRKLSMVIGSPGSVLRKATAVLFIHASPKASTGEMDCNLAYQNGSLMAEALGVSQFYTGFVLAAYAKDPEKALSKIIGTDQIVYAGMALGMPKYHFKKYMDKKPLRFNEI